MPELILEVLDYQLTPFIELHLLHKVSRGRKYTSKAYEQNEVTVFNALVSRSDNLSEKRRVEQIIKILLALTTSKKNEDFQPFSDMIQLLQNFDRLSRWHSLMCWYFLEGRISNHELNSADMISGIQPEIPDIFSKKQADRLNRAKSESASPIPVFRHLKLRFDTNIFDVEVMGFPVVYGPRSAIVRTEEQKALKIGGIVELIKFLAIKIRINYVADFLRQRFLDSSKDPLTECFGIELNIGVQFSPNCDVFLPG